MRSLVFSKRNLKEILRDPLSLMFCFIFPLFVFILMQIIIRSIGNVDFSTVPQFKIENLTSSIIVFSLSFLTLFAGMQVAKDRTSALTQRLIASPMKSFEYIVGYALPLLVVAIIQIIISIACGLIFGLNFSWGIVVSLLANIPTALLFIMLGILLGSLLSDKAVSGVSSIFVNVCAIFGGMFFPLDNMAGGLVIAANILPFKNCINIAKSALLLQNFNLLQSILVTLGYLILFTILASLIFIKILKKDKR